MKEKEKQDLIQRILGVTKDRKSARVAASIFVNRADGRDAAFFLDYLDHPDMMIRKMARGILAQMGVWEAWPLLWKEWQDAVGSLTFMPDEEYREERFFSNLTEILEGLGTLAQKKGYQDVARYRELEKIFLRTHNEDVRFGLIKLMALLGGQEAYARLMEFYGDYTDKERRALYYIYAYVPVEGRMELYKKGLKDPANHEFALTNMMGFSEGRAMLAADLARMDLSAKQLVLRVLQTEKHPDFIEPLIEMLGGDNRFVAEGSAELLKDLLGGGGAGAFPRERFQEMVATGYLPHQVQSAMNLLRHALGPKAVDLLLDALSRQALYPNKAIILEGIFLCLKEQKRVPSHLGGRLVELLLPAFDSLSEEREPFQLTALKVFSHLDLAQSLQLKTLRKVLLGFFRQHEASLSVTLKNNMTETLGRIGQSIARAEQDEQKRRDIELLFDLPLEKLEASRMERLGEQIEEAGVGDEAFRERLDRFLQDVYARAGEDWRKRTETVKLAGRFGGPNLHPWLLDVAREDGSLGVRVAAQGSAEQCAARWDLEARRALVQVPLFYLRKLIGDACQEMHLPVVLVEGSEPLLSGEVPRAQVVFLSEELIPGADPAAYLETLRSRTDAKRVVVVVGESEAWRDIVLPWLVLLKKPFRQEHVLALLQGGDGSEGVSP